MPKRSQRSKLKSFLVVTVIVLGGAVTIWAVINYVDWGSPSKGPIAEYGNGNNQPQRNLQREANVNSTQGTNNERQASPEPSLPPEKINVDILGTVKTEDGVAVGDALVAVYRDTQHGATPQFTNDNGEFKFPALPLRPGNTYTLLAKAPGLSGDFTFTTQNIKQGKQAISLEVVLTPVSIPSSPKSSPSESPPYREESEKLDAIDKKLGNISFSLGTTVVLGFCLLVVLLLASALMIWRARHIKALREVSVHLANLAYEQANTAREFQKLGKIEDVNQNIRRIVSGCHDLNNSVVRAEKKLTTILEKLRKQRNRAKEQTQGTDQLVGTAKELDSNEPALAAESYERAAIQVIPDFRGKAIDSYHLILSNQPPTVNPIYLEIDTERSAGSPLQEKKLAFREVGQGSFIVFSGADQAKGWLFPNPRPNYSEDLSQVFKDLTRENFSSKKSNIQPEQVERTDDYWSLRFDHSM
jgi:hypothetical protein